MVASPVVDEQCEECGVTQSFKLTPRYVIISTDTSLQYLIEKNCTDCGHSNCWFGEFQLEWIG
jgi:hypothetical protein